jgi:5-methylcytosine-specific restriction enzyme subunit McrC
MGYEDVEVTQPSNDKGVDVKAVAQFGITTINEVIQVKRHRANIQRSVLDMLRGSLHVPGWNPRGQLAPTPRPDFVVTKGTASVAVLDAKYRDLWENPLPREMLYQLALYATVHEAGASTILYPTIHPQASEARIAIREPVRGGRRATISLRPVLLGRMESLIAARPTPSVSRERRDLAQRLAFGAPNS